MTPEDPAMGQLLRRFWMPALLPRELAADGSPVRVRLFSEDLVAFRNTDGKIGLLQEFCAIVGLRCIWGTLIFASKSDGRNTTYFPVFFGDPNVTR
jgi:hypothetical protein